MLKSMRSNKTGQAGFALLDVLAAIAIFALLLPGIVSFLKMTSQSTAENAAASHIKRVATAAREYVFANHDTVTTSATATNSYGITVTTLRNDGFLPSGFNNRNVWNQTYNIYVLNPEEEDVHLIVLTSGGRGTGNTDFENLVVPSAAAKLGAEGGYIPTGQISGESSSRLQGAYGGWSFALAGTDISNPGAGHLAYSEYIDQDQFGSDYLYRVDMRAVGKPELNTMKTALDMDGNTIDNINTAHFEDEDATSFDCTNKGDGSVFFDDNNENGGLFVCRNGERVKISDSMNSAMLRDATIYDNESLVEKPACGNDGDTYATTPQIYVVPVYYSDNDSGRDIKGVQAWADNYDSDHWRIIMKVKTDQGWGTPSAQYGKLFVITKCGV